MLKSNPKSSPTVVRALGKIGDTAATEGVIGALDRSETDIRVEAHVGARATRRTTARSMRCARRSCRFTTLSDQTLAECREPRHCGARQPLRTRLPCCAAPGTLTQRCRSARADQQRTLLIESADVSAIMKSAETLQRLDIATLKPGDMLEGRYKYIEQHRHAARSARCC